MLDFKPITIDDKEIIESFTKKKNYFMCSFSFVDLFIWAEHYKIQFCIKDGFLFIKIAKSDGSIYTPPIGEGDFKNAVKEIETDAYERNIPFSMSSIPTEIKEKLELEFPGRFIFTEDLDREDYIYTSESLITLKGKKFHSKRNFINRFKQLYDGRWKYEELSDENMNEIFEFHLDWCGLKQCDDKDNFLGETCAVSRALKNYKKLDIKGGLIRLDGKIIAFSLGSSFNEELFIVHIEKANTEIAGAYQLINQQFAEHNCSSFAYIDREEDCGIEGLRKAKQSYYPFKLGVNYSAKIISEN